MPTVAIVYFSAQGHTHQITEGAKGVSGTTVELVRIVGTDIVEGRWKNQAALDTLATADAIVFGTPRTWAGTRRR